MDEDTKLMIAAQKGYLSQITKLLDEGADVNEKNVNEGTAIAYAITRGRLPVIKLLLSRGADLNTVNEDGVTLLMVAAYAGEEKVIQYLLDLGMEIDAVCDHGSTALHYAAEETHVNAIKVLFDNGADINHINKDGKSVLSVCRGRYYLEAREFILSHCIKEESIKTSSHNMNDMERKSLKQEIDLAKNSSDIEAIAKLMYKQLSKNNVEGVSLTAPYADLEYEYGYCCENLLLMAARNGFTKIAKVLLENGANPNVTEYWDRDVCYSNLESALEYAFNNDDRALVNILIDNNISLNVYENKVTPLMRAFYKRDMKMMENMIKNGANQNAKISVRVGNNLVNASVLSMAIIRNEKEYFDFLIEQGADVNCEVSSKNYSTPLFIATQTDRLDMLKILLEKGALYKTEGGNVKSAFLQAVEHGQTEIVEYFLNNGTDINEQESPHKRKGLNEHNTALMLASKNNNVDMIKLLLSRGALIDMKNNNNQTALTLGVQLRAVDAVKILVENGAEVPENGLATIGFGKYIETPLLSVAACSGNIGMLEYLLSIGVDLEMKDKEGYTPLARAIKSYEPEAADYLIERGASLKAITDDDIINKYNKYKEKCKRTLK